MNPSDYAYTPDLKNPNTWKLRIDDVVHVGGAIAALTKGFRGQKVQIPVSDLASVKAKVIAAWVKFHPDEDPENCPLKISAAHSSQNGELFLRHYGVKGMHWGVITAEVPTPLNNLVFSGVNGFNLGSTPGNQPVKRQLRSLSLTPAVTVSNNVAAKPLKKSNSKASDEAFRKFLLKGLSKSKSVTTDSKKGRGGTTSKKKSKSLSAKKAKEAKLKAAKAAALKAEAEATALEAYRMQLAELHALDVKLTDMRTPGSILFERGAAYLDLYNARVHGIAAHYSKT